MSRYSLRSADPQPIRQPQAIRTAPAPQGGATGADDRMDEAADEVALARLARSLQSVQRECAMAVSQTRRPQRPRGLPRAAQLGPVAGIPRIDAPERSDESLAPIPAEAESLAGTLADIDASARKSPLPFHLAPPIASDRLQPLRPARRRNNRLRGALYILIASLIVGSIAYQISGGRALTATDAAHAALSAVAGRE